LSDILLASSSFNELNHQVCTVSENKSHKLITGRVYVYVFIVYREVIHFAAPLKPINVLQTKFMAS